MVTLFNWRLKNKPNFSRVLLRIISKCKMAIIEGVCSKEVNIVKKILTFGNRIRSKTYNYIQPTRKLLSFTF